MVVEVNLKNGATDSAEVLSPAGFVPIILETVESDLIPTIVSALDVVDETNFGWLALSEVATAAETINLKSTAIVEATTEYDKGVLASEDITNPITSFVDWILNRRISVAGGNILAWVIIKAVDASNFLVEVAVYDALDNINSVDITFVDYTGPAPIPLELNLVSPTIVSPNIKIFSINTLTFDDPPAAIGETYGIVVDFKDAGAGSLGYAEPYVPVQAI